MLTRVSVLDQLAMQLRDADFPLTDNWHLVDDWFRPWAAQPGLRQALRRHVRTLQPEPALTVASKSRETTTHFAWCLLDRPEDPFSFWLHEYKPQQDWRHGYADSVHNHRYHFCTTILRGNYVHERYDAELDPKTGLISSATLRQRAVCLVGASGSLQADEFHRIPTAAEDAMTFLVKSRAVRESSLSYDPSTRISHRHVPVEVRLGDLARRI
ncbi:hypothetical protein AB5J62_39355 [Amycolatopsis sp. cg5]|uniref:hypothetical protein n=1 Tax=Amycolatopsis sp. cg5 TaxID=3238802 RepID=UPI003524D5ED